MSWSVTCTPEVALKHAGMTADQYLAQAIKSIDERLGKGYAAKHPELIGQHMLTQAQDFHTTVFLRTSADRK